MDLLRAVGIAGIPSVSVSPPTALSRYSRHCNAAVHWHHPLKEPEALLASLEEFTKAVCERPVLFYQGDGDTLFISRFRERLARCFRFVIPEAALVEALVDKRLFQQLAELLELPVPPSETLTPSTPPSSHTPVFGFPALVKPVARQLAAWQALAGHAKAVQVDSLGQLTEVWARAAELGTAVLVQRLISGDETRVESYHVYVDEGGRIAAEFTGRKLRTYPVRFGHSTALEITGQEDLRRLGAELVHRMELRGVAKLDFKRDGDGKLHLLEVNPRFNLWHHLAAVAGLNLPALVYADLTGSPRPPVTPPAPGTGWSRPVQDLRSIRASGGSFASWVRWTARARARSGLSGDDPLLVAGWALRQLTRFAGRSGSGPGRVARAPRG
jgi:predicted ATP-grasp superfamily ATP-dependent carboligase